MLREGREQQCRARGRYGNINNHLCADLQSFFMRVNTRFFRGVSAVVTLIGSECSANMLKLLTGFVVKMNVWSAPGASKQPAAGLRRAICAKANILMYSTVDPYWKLF